MSVETPPVFIQSGGETAERARRALHALAGLRGGIVAAGDLAVTENGTPNMSVNVATGQVLIPGTEGTYQGVYEVENRGTLNVAIAAADPTNPRKDLIVAKLQDAAYSGGTNAASIVAVTGTPAGSPAEPAVPANAWVLAMVDVPALDTAITNSQITDRRTSQTNQKGQAAALGGVVVCTSGNRPPHVEGRVIYETDTDKVFVSDGSNWTLPKNQPAGIAAIATPLTSSVGPTSSTTELDIITAAAFTPMAGNRRIRITFHCRGFTGSVVNDTFIARIKEGSTVLEEVHIVPFGTGTGAHSGPGTFSAIVDSPSVASHTYKATMQRAGGTGTLTASATATAPITLTVEDIGGI